MPYTNDKNKNMKTLMKAGKRGVSLKFFIGKNSKLKKKESRALVGEYKKIYFQIHFDNSSAK